MDKVALPEPPVDPPIPGNQNSRGTRILEESEGGGYPLGLVVALATLVSSLPVPLAALLPFPGTFKKLFRHYNLLTWHS